MDIEKLTKELEKASPGEFAKFVQQVVGRLTKATDHLAKAAKHLGDAIETHGKIGDGVDKLEEQHASMADHLAGMKDCMGKAVASGKLGKAEEEGDGKDLLTHMSGISDVHDSMGKEHDAIQKLIDTNEENLDNAQGAIEDATDAAGEETDKGLSAAARTEKRYNRKIEAISKASDRRVRDMEKQMKSQLVKAQRSIEDGFNQMLKALAPPPQATPAPKDFVPPSVPVRTGTPVEKSADGGARAAAAASAGGPPVAATSNGAQIPATDEYGMPNPEYLKAVESGQVGRDGGSAFVKAAGAVEAQVGDPFPKDETNLFREVHRPGAVN